MLSRLAVIAFLAISLVGAAVTWGVQATETASRRATFDNVLQEATRLLETRIEQHIALLTATRAFLQTQPGQPTRETFADFVRGLGLEDRYSGLQGLGLSRILTPDAEGAVEADLVRDYGSDRGIWPEPVPGLRTGIVLLEPSDERNRVAIGYDMSTEERRREAMLRALETGAASATAPLTLVQEITEDRQTGLLIFLPLAQGAGQELRGFAYAPVRMGDLFAAALEGHALPLELRATDDASPDEPLFESAGFAEAEGRLEGRADLTVAGRDWTLVARATSGFAGAERLRYTLFSAVTFALLALATGFAVHWQGAAIRRARALNEAVQRNVEQKDFLLAEMSHRMKNALARVSAIARQSARDASSKEEMIEDLGARLRAMAAAQDLLVRSGTDSADLADLVRSELEQIHGGAMRLGSMSGPPVRLDARQGHALGLVFHELATNALKYGAGSQEGGELRITWATAPGPAGPELLLTWEERTPEPAANADAAPADISGFGTRLVDISVTRELGGSVTRRPHGHGLTVEMRIPLT